MENCTCGEHLWMEREAAECRIAARRVSRNEQSLAVSEALSAEPQGSSSAVREVVDAHSANAKQSKS